MPAFERRVLSGGWLVALPALAALAIVLLTGRPEVELCWLLAVAVLVLTAMLARWQHRRVVYPLYTLVGLLEALREGDYSLRGVSGGVLGEAIYDINALADRLQRERLQSEDSARLLGQTLASRDSAVFVFDSGRARLVPVELAGRNGSDAWVGRGLQAGAAVIVYPPPDVHDGAGVRRRRV